MTTPNAIPLLKNDQSSDDPRLDRVVSSTHDHLDKYPLTPKTITRTISSMMVAVNWYENFDRPVEKKIKGVERDVIGQGELGRRRGGHAVCGRNWKLKDSPEWWEYYDQGQEGRCVEFAALRILTQMNRKRYDITSRFHYHMAQHIDEWAGCYLGHGGRAYAGTSGRAGLEVLRSYGAVVGLRGGEAMTEDVAAQIVSYSEGIAEYRWATSWDQVREALGVPDYLPGIPINNSWGKGYPREVILLDDAGERVLREDGEFGIVVDR